MTPEILVVLGVALAGAVLASRFYGTFLERVFGVDDRRRTPAYTERDGRDYEPAQPHVLFAHHFAAIAGAGPIIGPTLAFAYGWLPGFLWVFLGAILLGGVHDMATLFVSVREKGKSVAEIARSLFGRRGYGLCLGLLGVALVMITATFLNLSVAALTSTYPAARVGIPPPADPGAVLAAAAAAPGAEWVPFDSGALMPEAIHRQADGQGSETLTVHARIGGIASTSVLVVTLVAPLLGWWSRRRIAPRWLDFALASAVCAGSVAAGLWFPVVVSGETWRGLMTVYVVLASALPVWLVLMPRDFINVQILYAGLAAMIVGLLVSGLGAGAAGGSELVAEAARDRMPMFDWEGGTSRLGFLWPTLLITISCGAISGFHSLVASGTSAKQLPSERHSRTIGYHGMLLEMLLATGVILTLWLSLGRSAYLELAHDGRNPVLAIALGTGRVLDHAFALPAWAGTVLGILLLEGFVVTTLDVAVRLNRYLVEEFWKAVWPGVPRVLLNPWGNTLLCAAAMYGLSRTNALTVLWKVFGTANQMMAAVALLVASAWLFAHGRRIVFTLLPAAFMFATTLASAGLALRSNLQAGNLVLATACFVLIALALGLILLATTWFLRRRAGFALGATGTAA